MKIKHKIERINQTLSIIIECNIELRKNSTISIANNDNIISPMAVDNGYIKNNKIFITSNHVIIKLPYSYGVFELIYSYNTEKDIISSESMKFSIEKIDIKSINENDQILYNNIVKSSYNFQDVSKWLTLDNTFGWKAIVHFEDDIKIRFIKKGNLSALCLGEKTHELIHSDYIFNLTDKQNEINIPKTLIQKLDNKQIGCFVLCKGNFYNIDNLYYKIPISNFVNFSISSETLELTDPLGNILNV